MENTVLIRAFSASSAEKEKIIETLNKELFCQKDILFAFLYGSFLEEGVFRDIDIGIYVKDIHSIPALYEFKLEEQLEEAIGRAFPVEVRLINEAPVTFLYHVIRGKLLFCREDDLCLDFIVTVARKYHDIQPILIHYTREAYERKD